MSDFRRHREASLEDPEFKREWNAQSAECEVMTRIIEARLAEGMTQTELSEACGMKPTNLYRLENGNGNPSVAMLARIAAGLGRRLEISFARLGRRKWLRVVDASPRMPQRMIDRGPGPAWKSPTKKYVS